MKTKHYRNLLLTGIILFSFTIIYSKEYSAKINPLIEVADRVINLGPCLVGDSVFCNFELINDGEKKIYMERLAPSYYLGASPNDETKFQFTLFRENSFLPKVFEPGEKFVFSLGFRAGDTLVTKVGWHEALLAMSFLREDLRQPPPITPIDSFYIRVKKTLKYFDNFIDIVNFDSVYINSSLKESKLWKGKNTTYKDIILKERKINYITQPQIIPEFEIGQEINNLTVIPKGVIEREFYYKPVDKGIDSAIITHYFLPEPTEMPEKIDSIKVLLIGTGVEQRLEIIGSNVNFRNDTLFVEDTFTDNDLKIEVYLKNTGNIPIFAKNEELRDLFLNTVTDEINIYKKLQNNEIYLKPQEIDTVIFELKPKNLGKFSYNYKIITNLNERKIKGVTANTDLINFYITGEYKSPRMVLYNSEIDFGNIILNRIDCPARKDTAIRITNLGNSKLIINKIEIMPEYPNSPFKTEITSLEIEPSASKDLILTFEAVSNMESEYFAELYLFTNEIFDNNVRKIQLKSSTKPTEPINLIIPRDIKAKPGGQILVPIVVSNYQISPTQIATNFSTEIIYNRSILEYIGTVTIGTASEGAINRSQLGENDNELVKIAFEAPPNGSLKNKDTLILLKFNTYLGDEIASNITMVEPKLGDNRCPNIFDMNISNGLFITDSVCGINYKVVKKIATGLYINVFENEKDRSKIIEYNIPFKSRIVLKIYDGAGNLIKKLLDDEIPEGTYQFVIDEIYLKSGYYILTLENKFQLVSKPLIITK